MVTLSTLRCAISDKQLSSRLRVLSALPDEQRADVADWLRRSFSRVGASLDTLRPADAVRHLDTLSILAEKEVRFSKGSPYLASHPVSRAAPVEIVWLQAKIKSLQGKIDAAHLQRLEGRIAAFVGEAAVESQAEEQTDQGQTPGKIGRRAKTWQSRSWMRGDTVHAAKGSDSQRRRATRQD